jgi:hypothetical protein
MSADREQLPRLSIARCICITITGGALDVKDACPIHGFGGHTPMPETSERRYAHLIGRSRAEASARATNAPEATTMAADRKGTILTIYREIAEGFTTGFVVDVVRVTEAIIAGESYAASPEAVQVAYMAAVEELQLQLKEARGAL